MAAKYKKIDPRMWNDEKFRSLDHTDKLIAVYVITAQSNRIGLFVFSVAQACEDLDIEKETFAERFGNVCQTLNWVFDSTSRVVFLPTWWKYNQPDNPNSLKGCLDDTHDLPQTELLKQFCCNGKYLEKKHAKVWRTFAKRSGNVTPQEHEHEHEQEDSPQPPKGGQGSKRKRAYGSAEEEAAEIQEALNARKGATS